MANDQLSTVFGALADPTRRAILASLVAIKLALRERTGRAVARYD